MPFDIQSDRVTAALSAAKDTSVTVHLYGATVMSWKVNGHERLFLSEKAILNGSKAIRGGIPLVFPQFGTVEGSKLPQHGFARCSLWKLTEHTETGDKATLKFTLTPAEVSQALRDAWNFAFLLEYTVVLTASGTLETTLSVTNKDARKFDWTWLLHTYVRVPAIENVHVHGLEGHDYVDKTRNLSKHTQASSLTVTEETDRIFAAVPTSKSFKVASGTGELIMEVERAHGMPANYADVVVWNPWTEKARGMADFADHEWKHMICVEVGDVAHPLSLEPGQTRSAGQILRVAQNKL